MQMHSLGYVDYPVLSCNPKGCDLIAIFLQALAYFEQLKSSDTGWQLAINTLINTNPGPNLNDHVKFFALQVVEVFIKQSYQKSGLSQQQAIKNFLSQWIQLQVRYLSYEIDVCITMLTHSFVFEYRFLNLYKIKFSSGIKLPKYLLWCLCVIILRDGRIFSPTYYKP